MANSRSQKSWDETVAGFEEHLRSRGRSSHCVAAYRSTLKRFGHFYLEELKKPGPHPSRLQETDLQAFIGRMRSTEYSAASSINRAVAALRSFSRYLIEERTHKRDIGKDLRTYFVALPAPRKGLSQPELRRLVASVDLNSGNGRRDLAIIQLLVQCGLRVGEIPRLCPDDLTIHETSGKVRVKDEKTRSDRLVPLNASARSALKNYLDRREATAGTDPLFLSQFGKRISTKTVQHMVKKHLSLAGRADLSAHDLRHNFALSFYAKSTNLAAVQRVLGHRSALTTTRYLQPAEEKMPQAVEDLPENIWHGEEPRQ